MRSERLTFYERVKLINFARARTAERRCFACSELPPFASRCVLVHMNSRVSPFSLSLSLSCSSELEAHFAAAAHSLLPPSAAFSDERCVGKHTRSLPHSHSHTSFLHAPRYFRPVLENDALLYMLESEDESEDGTAVEGVYASEEPRPLDPSLLLLTDS